MAEYDNKVVTGDRLKPLLEGIRNELLQKISFGTCDTAAATAAKVVTVTKTFPNPITEGTLVAVYFSNSVPANATLNVNSTGAKSIYYNGSAITSGIITAKMSVLLSYNGTQYDVIGVTDISGKMNKGVTLNTSTDTVTDNTITDLHFSDQSNVKASFNTTVSPGESLIELTAKTATASLEGTGRADVISWTGSAIPQFKSAVKISGSDNDTPNTFVIPAATKNAFGVVKVGDNIIVNTSIDNNYGTISVTNENLGQGYGTTSTAAATTDKAVTMSGYSLVAGGIVTVKFTYAVNAGQKLNINSKKRIDLLLIWVKSETVLMKNVLLISQSLTGGGAEKVVAGKMI